MTSLKSKIRKTDLFGKFLILEEEENQKHTTVFGLLVSFLIVVTCIVVGFLFGKEIYERKNPTVYNSNDKLSKSIIKLTEFPIFFTYVTGAGVFLPNAHKYINMELTHLIMADSYAEYPTLKYYSGHKKCNVSEFSETYQPLVAALYDSNTFDINCILYNEDMYFSDDYSTLGSSLINVRFVLNKSNSTQEFLDEQEALLRNLYITMTYFDSFIDSSVYKNPINYYNTVQAQQLSIGLLQRKFLNVERLKLITHKGWLLENIEEQEVFSVRSSYKDVISDKNGNLYYISLTSPNIRTKIVRTYMKIQDMFAKVGGFFNALFIIATVMSKHYVDFSYYRHIYQHFYKFKKPENALTKTQRSMVHRLTIDKIVNKFAESEINANGDKNVIKNSIIQCINNSVHGGDEVDKTKSNFLKRSENIFNSNNNVTNTNTNNNYNYALNSRSRENNEFHHFNPTRLVSSNKFNSLNNRNNFRKKNNNTSSSILNPQLVNNFVETAHRNNSNHVLSQVNKQNNNSKTNDNNNNVHINNNNVPNIPISNNINLPLSKTNESIKINLNQNIEEFTDENIHYFSYIWNDLICSRSKFKYQKQAVKKVLSFNSLLEVNYDHFIKTDKFNANASNDLGINKS